MWWGFISKAGLVVVVVVGGKLGKTVLRTANSSDSCWGVLFNCWDRRKLRSAPEPFPLGWDPSLHGACKGGFALPCVWGWPKDKAPSPGRRGLTAKPSSSKPG